MTQPTADADQTPSADARPGSGDTAGDVPGSAAPTAEHRRLRSRDSGDEHWDLWGPYLAERGWGTVREDYSDDGDAWGFFPHDHARSRAYRWGEDGLCGISDDRQYLCFAIALWNGVDPILKERLFGLAGPEGNHGEDVKEEYWYLDATPTSSFLQMRYAYPHAVFPYDHLVTENVRRGRDDPEHEILDTGVFEESRYFTVDVTYAKASVDDVLIRIDITNNGPDPARCVLLPQMWFRNTWSWGYPDGPMGEVSAPPTMRADGDESIVADHPVLGEYELVVDATDSMLFTGNETDFAAIGVGEPTHRFTKNAFHRHVVDGEEGAVSPSLTGTKATFLIDRNVAPGATVTTRLRLRRHAPDRAEVFDDFDIVADSRVDEADEFYAAVHHPALGDDERLIQRRALAGMLWSRNFYYFDVRQWLAGDPDGPTPPHPRSRNTDWGHFNAFDILSMPDAWEYPWFATWDSAFHTVALAMVDPTYAKHQLRLMTREWYMHPNGQLAAYEWEFGDVNPPVHAWAAWKIHELEAEMTGVRDREFLEAVFHKLLLNFTWWVNRKDDGDNNVFQGGFLGLDNISVFNRSEALPDGGHLDQADGTAWMAFYTLEMLKISIALAYDNPAYQDIATKFLEHFTAIAAAMNGDAEGPGLWDENDHFFYDSLHAPDGSYERIRARSMVGLLPLLGAETVASETIEPLHDFVRRMRWFLTHRPKLAEAMARLETPGKTERLLFSVLDRDRLTAVLSRMLDEAEFLSPFGVRSLSKAHASDPFVFDPGAVGMEGPPSEVRYDPAESTSALFGGNSNWRGPVWMPVNVLLLEALQEYSAYYGDGFSIAYPTGGKVHDLHTVAGGILDRIIALFERGPNGVRPSLAARSPLVPDPWWDEEPLFHEYFHGDSGVGLGASHQTGWTGLVAVLIDRRARRRAPD